MNQIGSMCQAVYIKKNDRINNTNICINCKSFHWNKIRMDKRKYSNYDEHINAGTHLKSCYYLQIDWKRELRMKLIDVNHQQKILIGQKKLDKLKDEVEAKSDEVGDIFFKYLNSKMTKLIIKEQ